MDKFFHKVLIIKFICIIGEKSNQVVPSCDAVAIFAVLAQRPIPELISENEGNTSFLNAVL